MRIWDVERKRQEFTEFYTSAKDDCLRIVLVTVGDRQLAEDLVAEAFTWAWMSWRTVRAHPVPHAWSVNTTPGGLIDVTVRELTHPAALRQALAQAGLPAHVTFGTICEASSGAGGLPQLNQVLGHSIDDKSVIMTINPATMPAGTELLIGLAHPGPGFIAVFSLLKDDVPISCRPIIASAQPSPPTAPRLVHPPSPARNPSS